MLPHLCLQLLDLTLHARRLHLGRHIGRAAQAVQQLLHLLLASMQRLVQLGFRLPKPRGPARTVAE